MYGNYQYLSQLRDQAHEYVNDQKGHKHLDVDERHQLIPFEEQRSVWSFIPWGTGKRSVQRMDDLQNSCVLAGTKADTVAEKLGLRERIAAHLKDLNWQEMTIEQLAVKLDEILATSSASLLKAQDAIDSIIDRCKAYADERYGGLGLDQKMTDFKRKLSEAFDEFHQAHGGDYQACLDQFQNGLKNSVAHAFITMGGQPDHKNQGVMVFMANQIEEAFQQALEEKRGEEKRGITVPHTAPVIHDPDPKSEAGVFSRYVGMMRDLSDIRAHGKDLNDRIRGVAVDTIELVETSDDPVTMLKNVREFCDKKLTAIKDKNKDLRISVELFTDSLDLLDNKLAKPHLNQPLEYLPPQMLLQPRAEKRSSPPLETTDEAVSTTGAQAVPSVDLTGLKKRISGFAQYNIKSGHTDFCRKLFAQIRESLTANATPLQEQIWQLDGLIAWMNAPMGQAHQNAPFLYSNLEDEIQLPLIALREELSGQLNARRQLSPATRGSTQPVPQTRMVPEAPRQEPSITKKQLQEEGLIRNDAEYSALCELMGASYMQWPGVKSRLSAFRQLQRYNPGITNQHFNILMRAIPQQDQERWCADLNQYQHSAQPYADMMPPVRYAVELLAQRQQVCQEVLDVIPLIDMDGLSAPHLLEQLTALSMLQQNLGSHNLTPQQMAYVINNNVLTELTISRIMASWQSHQALQEYAHGLIEQVQRSAADRARRKQDYHQIAQYTQNKFGLTPKQVTANGDCFYAAIGHLMREPMLKVRQKCHWTAEDLLDMKNGSFRGDLSTDYAKRLTLAARNLTHEQLGDIGEKVQNHAYLTPAFQRADDQQISWGQRDDMIIVSLVYGCPSVPITHDANFVDAFGFQTDGTQYWSTGKPDAAQHFMATPGSGPLMLIYNDDHWDPLVAHR